MRARLPQLLLATSPQSATATISAPPSSAAATSRSVSPTSTVDNEPNATPYFWTPSAGQHPPAAGAGHHQTRTRRHPGQEPAHDPPAERSFASALGRMFPVSTDCTMPGIWLTASRTSADTGKHETVPGSAGDAAPPSHRSERTDMTFRLPAVQRRAVRREQIAHDLVIGAAIGTRLNLRSATGHHLESASVNGLAHSAVLDQRVINVPQQQHLLAQQSPQPNPPVTVATSAYGAGNLRPDPDACQPGPT